jgi:hypothetical protein
MSIGCSTPGYSGYDSMRSKARLRARAFDLELRDEHG